MSLLQTVQQEVIERLGNLSVTARQAVESVLSGQHRSVRRGSVRPGREGTGPLDGRRRRASRRFSVRAARLAQQVHDPQTIERVLSVKQRTAIDESQILLDIAAGQRRGRIEQRHQKQRVGVGRHACPIHFLVSFSKRGHHGVVTTECLDHLRAADGLFHDAIQTAELALQALKPAPRVARDELREPEHDRHNQQRRQCQIPPCQAPC